MHTPEQFLQLTVGLGLGLGLLFVCFVMLLCYLLSLR